jgi:SAM-dependent methyltransferase/predicted O-methyltransferase YrrM
VPNTPGSLRERATRVRRLWTLFRNEREEPEPFYRELAYMAADDLEHRYGPLRGQTIADLGCGPGWYADELRSRGARVLPLDGSLDELLAGGRVPAGAVVGDAGRLPMPDACVDGVMCSNLLEHACDTAAVIGEVVRVLKPGGWGYVSWTNWYSPHGGHDMTPWHLLGPAVGPRVYERLHGPPRKNRYGEGLFAVHIGPTLRLVRSRHEVSVEQVEPRYWPWARAVMSVPGVREVAAWNCVIRLRKRRAAESLVETMEAVSTVDGWMTDDQGRRLWDRAAALRSPATIVEIGSYRGRSAIVLARAAAPGVSVIAIDPHAGNDRGPQQWTGTAQEGQRDHDAFSANLAAAGVSERVRHVRKFSHDALDDVHGPVDLLYVDGAHGYGPALDDVRRWGARVRGGGTMLVHDSFSSVGVTLALLRGVACSGDWRYEGRAQSMAEYTRVRVRGWARCTNAVRQLLELPWFVRNVLVKALIVARLAPLTRLLGHRQGTWPY